jgi:iron complex transport system ATP-binding protein
MDRMSAPAIEWRGVTAGYREQPVLRGMDLLLPAGAFAGVIGPNGAGKSTMLRVMSGLLRPREGTARAFGEDLVAAPAPRRAALVGVVPQFLDTPMAFTVEEVVLMGRTAAMGRWRGPSEADREAAERAMVFTDVVGLRRRPLEELSGGERQRAVIAMALAQGPRAILLDEPTSHLDINHRLEVMQILERLNRENGTTVVLVSHDLNLAADFCGMLYLLEAGRIKAQGAPPEVLTEANLSEVYRCDVRVQRDTATGSVSVLPSRRLAPAAAPGGARIHVIAGGGCAEELLRRLAVCGFGVSCGVLNAGDSDAATAHALGMDVALDRPFSPVGGASLAAARELAQRADAVVLAGVPFGPGNLPNLVLAEEAREAGRAVWIMEGVESRDYTPDRAAGRRVQALLAAGAKSWHSVQDLTDRLRAGSARVTG